MSLCRGLVINTYAAASCGLAGIENVSFGGAGGSNGNACIKVVVVAGARGSSHIERNILAEHNEAKLGIVYEDVTGSGDGFYRIVSAKLPGIDGICLHPLEKNLAALHNAAGAPSVRGIAPTNVNVEEDTSYVTAKIVRAVRLLVGIVISRALTVCGVTSRGVLARRGGTKHHDIVLVVAAKALTVRPGVLAVPVAIPAGTDRLAGIEGGDCSAAILAVGISVKILGFIVTGLVSMRVRHKRL